MFLSNEGASRVLSLLGVDISNDTIQRLYDNSTPLDAKGRPIQFDDRKRNLNNSQYKKQAESRKKNRS